MTRQIDLFDKPVSMLSDEFTAHIATVLMHKGGITHAEAFVLCKRAVEGRLCPVCGTTMKVYTRKMTPEMVRVLKQLRGIGKPVETKHLQMRGGDYAKLPKFGLVNLDENGLWSITQQGRDFLDGFGSAPSFAAIFMGELVGVSVASCKYRGTIDGFKIDHITSAGVERVYLR